MFFPKHHENSSVLLQFQAQVLRQELRDATTGQLPEDVSPNAVVQVVEPDGGVEPTGESE